MRGAGAPLELVRTIARAPQLSILAAAVIAAVVQRAAFAFQRPARPLSVAPSRSLRAPPPGRVTRVCFACAAAEDWRPIVAEHLQSARAPSLMRFSVMIECARPEDALLEHEDSLFRAITTLAHVPAFSRRAGARGGGCARRVARMASRFVDGTEQMVAICDPRVKMAYGWDVVAARLLEEADEGDAVVLTAACGAHSPAFPTLEEAPGGGARRGASLPLARPTPCDGARAIGVVTWCPEFTAGAPAAFESWPARKARAAEQTTDALFTATCALLRPDAALAARLEAEQAGEARPAPPTPHEKVGLTQTFTTFEAVHKYGNVKVATLKHEFVNREGAREGG